MDYDLKRQLSPRTQITADFTVTNKIENQNKLDDKTESVRKYLLWLFHKCNVILVCIGQKSLL